MSRPSTKSYGRHSVSNRNFFTTIDELLLRFNGRCPNCKRKLDPTPVSINITVYNPSNPWRSKPPQASSKADPFVRTSASSFPQKGYLTLDFGGDLRVNKQRRNET